MKSLFYLTLIILTTVFIMDANATNDVDVKAQVEKDYLAYRSAMANKDADKLRHYMDFSGENTQSLEDALAATKDNFKTHPEYKEMFDEENSQPYFTKDPVFLGIKQKDNYVAYYTARKVNKLYSTDTMLDENKNAISVFVFKKIKGYYVNKGATSTSTNLSLNDKAALEIEANNNSLLNLDSFVKNGGQFMAQ